VRLIGSRRWLKPPLQAKARATIACFLLVTCAFAQTEFDAAVVKLNKSGAVEPSGGILPGGQFSVTNISMIEVLQFAYKVDGNAISGIPSWFRNDRFDIIGKGPANTPDATLRLMLQSLLAKEFKLAVHQERKPQNGFALVVAKGGPKLQKASAAPAAPSGQSEDAVDHCKRTAGGEGIEADCTGISMAELAKRLPSLAPMYVDRPVADMTGLSGTYDLKLQWTGKSKIETEGGLTIFDAITRQVGLKLEQRKIPQPSLVIDHIERLAEK
jgi:uncharacterized protein (TIGR03435 family)